MRLERLQRSITVGAKCVEADTPEHCFANSPDMQSAREDIATGRISRAEYLQAMQAADQQLKTQNAAPR